MSIIHRKNIMNLFRAAMLVMLVAALLPAQAAFAGYKVKEGVTLIFPDNQTACEPFAKVVSTGMPEGWTVEYQFFTATSAGVGSLIGVVTAVNNEVVKFYYPVESPYYAVTAVYFDASRVRMFKIGAKWSWSCEKPTKTPPPPPTETPPPPPTETPPPPPPGGGQGCTPGYWRQSHHYDSWVGYAPSNDFEAVFGVDASFDPHTLGDAVALGGGGERALARHAVAALLNSTNPGVSYLYSTAQVISMVQQAYATNSFLSIKNLFEAQNEAGCPLN